MFIEPCCTLRDAHSRYSPVRISIQRLSDVSCNCMTGAREGIALGHTWLDRKFETHHCFGPSQESIVVSRSKTFEAETSFQASKQFHDPLSLKVPHPILDLRTTVGKDCPWPDGPRQSSMSFLSV